MLLTSRNCAMFSIQKVLRANPSMSRPMAVKIINKRLREPQDRIGARRDELRQRHASKRRGILATNPRLSLPHGPASRILGFKGLRLQFLVDQHISLREERMPVAPEDYMDETEDAPFGAQSTPTMTPSSTSSLGSTMDSIFSTPSAATISSSSSSPTSSPSPAAKP
jgi:hypothetical protein